MTEQEDRHRAPASALRAHDIRRAYSGVHALQGVDLEIRPREILGLIGPNGAGKSTLVNIISGYDRPDSGSVLVDGIDVTSHSAVQRCRAGVARTFQHGHLYSGLTVRENVELAALGTGQSGRAARATATELMAAFGVAKREHEPARTLPHGVERRLGVARALATDPRYLLLDEPAAGLNDGEIGEFGESVQRIRDERGIGVLLIDHNIRLIMSVCERIHVVVQGRSYLEGTPTEVRASEALAEAYLGRSGRAQHA